MSDNQHAARLLKIKNMSQREWKAYKNKLKNKAKTSNKEKANKAAIKLSKMKQARKIFKESRKNKRFTQRIANSYSGSALETAVKM